MEKRKTYVRILREAGGLGDVIRLFPIMKGVKERWPDCILHFFCLSHYQGLVMPHHSPPGQKPYIDGYINVAMNERRPRMSPHDESRHSYLRRGIKYDFSIEAFCPAYVHEVEAHGGCWRERTELWCAHAKLPYSRPRYYLTEQEEQWADLWLKQVGAEEGNIVGVQPFGTTVSRNWPRDNWLALIDYLLNAGFFVVVLDCCGRVRNWPGHTEINRPWDQLGAIMSKIDVMISGDSGLFHLAGALNKVALGLFGLTNGAVLCKAYPGTAHWLGATRIPDNIPPNCKFPCYGRWERGYDAACRQSGCACLNAVEPAEVFEKVIKIFPGNKSLSKDWDIAKKVGKEYYTEDYWIKGNVSGYKNYNISWKLHYAIAEMLARVFDMKKGDKVLDYGGAFGFHAGILQQRIGVDAYLADASEHAILNCHELLKGKAQWIDVGAEPMMWEENFFDFVISIEMMEHIYIDEVSYAMKELFRVMKPGSLIYASIAYGNRRDPRFIDQTHQTMRPESFWRKHFDDAGFIQKKNKENDFWNFVSTVSPYKKEPLAQELNWSICVYQKPNT